MRSILAFCIIIGLIHGEELMEWKLSGGFLYNGFTTVVSMGTNPAGGPLQTFPLLVDLETSATLIPSNKCENCKTGAGYDRDLSETEEVITCDSNYCDKDKKSYCPHNHSSKGQCCSNYEKSNCGWDSHVGNFGSSYYAEGTIVRDEFIFTTNRFMAYFVDVFNSTFDQLPGSAVGILGLGEKSCNPTCIDPVYNSVRDSISYASNVFTICFGHKDGILAIGKNDRKFYKGDLLYTEQRPNEYGYTYDIFDLRLNNQTFTSFSSMIGNIKSNDNYISLPTSLFNLYKKTMIELYPSLPGVLNGTLFIGGAIHDIQHFPTFDIRVSGILFHLSPAQYFINYDASVNEYFLGIRESTKNTIDLGLVFLRGYNSVFDQEKTGFATALKDHCYGSDDKEAIGTVEWAPVVHHKPGKRHNMLLISIIIVLVLVVVVCIAFIIRLKQKNLQLSKQFAYTDMSTLPQVV